MVHIYKNDVQINDVYKYIHIVICMVYTYGICFWQTTA